MTFLPGARLGSYEITSGLGAGGMGEVFQARDTKLNRNVAIKVLPAAFADDPERLARFTREAQTLASLNHPNIAAIYGIEEVPANDGAMGSRALVMELVEGEDLSAHMARGPIPVTDALPIARQLAEALEAAHEQGIVHRDLKPANIKVRADGTVKVLDFGLAKAMDPAGASSSNPHVSHSPTLTHQGTSAGMIIGTAAYMSPEQAKGKPVDKRADIWAFGVVLYEMLTGRRAFKGEDVSETLASVLKDSPPMDVLPPGVPAPVRRLLRRCLEKDLKRRLSAIADARLELDEAVSGTADPVAGTARGSREWFWKVATAASLTGAASLAAWLWPRPANPTSPAQFTIPEPPKAPFFGNPRMMALSPDGQRLAFVAGAGAERRLWIRPLNSLAAQPVPGTEGATTPAWSPDGRSIAFASKNSTRATGDALLKRVELLNGTVVTLGPSADANPAWSPSGVILYSGPGKTGLFQIPESGGTPKAVTQLDASQKERFHNWPTFLPDGRRFLFSVRSRDSNREKSALFLASLDSPGRTHVLDGLTNAAYAGGFLVYQRDGVLLAQSFDEKRGRLVGDPTALANDVHADLNGGGAFTVWSNELLIYRRSQRSVPSTLTWLDASGRVIETVGGLVQNRDAGQLSPDRTRVVVTRFDGKQNDLWLIDVARDVATRLTFGPSGAGSPVWFPDGRRVAFRSVRSDKTGIYARATEGASSDELLVEDTKFLNPDSISSDGRILILMRSSDGPGADLWALPLTGDRKLTPVVGSPFNDAFGSLSPDGRWLAYSSDQAGGDQEVYVRSYPAGDQETRVSSTGGLDSAWSPDGRRLYYRTPEGALMSTDLSFPDGGVRVGASAQLFSRPDALFSGFAFDPVGPRFLLAIPPEREAKSLNVVINWTAELKK